MRKRLKVLAAVGILLTVICGYVCVRLLDPLNPINEANYERIKPGMTQAEVESILGGPATGRISTFYGPFRGKDIDVWEAHGNRICLEFSPGGKVVGATFQRKEQASLLKRLFPWFDW